MELLDMEEASGSFSKSNLDKGRKSILLFPGVTRAYKDKQGAVDFLDKKLASDAKQLFKVIFKVTVGGDQAPMDAKKFVGEDGEMKDAALCDALFNRLTAQVKSYTVDD